MSAPSGVQAPDARVPQVGAAWNRYAAQDQTLVRNGGFRVGLDEQAVYVARGKPEIFWATAIDGQNCRVLVYGLGADARAVDLEVLTCNGTVAHIAQVAPPLPCERLEQVAPRIVEQNVHFSVQPLERQWQILQGVVERGQSSIDLYVAFGAPYRQGREEREDRTTAMKNVYLDSSGDAYGMNVTLVNDRVVGWTIPAERVLTPEAQVKHQQQAIQQAVAEADARAQARYQEEQRRRNELQAQQQQQAQRQQQASAAVHTFLGVAAQSAAAGASGEGGGHVVDTHSSSRQVSGEKSLTVNGCRYTDAPGGALGASCSGGSPCPGGYSCSMPVGMCVPAGQGCKR
jgi:hypothetical protein